MPHETPSNAVDLTAATITVSPTLVATAATPPTITADATATDEVFASGRRGKYKTESCNSFAACVTALAADLTPTARVIDLAATGQ